MSTLAAMRTAPGRAAGTAPGERLAAGALVLTIVLWASAFAGIRAAGPTLRSAQRVLPARAGVRDR